MYKLKEIIMRLFLIICFLMTGFYSIAEENLRNVSYTEVQYHFHREGVMLRDGVNFERSPADFFDWMNQQAAEQD